MHRNRAITLILCCVLLMSQAAGIHVHVTNHAQDEHGPALEQHSHATVVALVDEQHADRHLAQGELDFDVPDTTAGKLPSMPLLLALACAVFALLLPGPGGAIWTRAYRPPARQRWLHLQPPSHGPPRIAS